MTGKTIQIYCTEGEPRGVRIAEMTTRIVQAIFAPRAKLEIAIQRPELKSVGVYYLFGHAEESSRPSVYIGEAEDCAERFRQHNAQKEFWNTAIAIVSRTQSFTKAHVRMLEWMSLQKARNVDRFEIENCNDGSKPFAPEPMLADVHEVFQTADVLLTTLGYPVFEPLVGLASQGTAETFFCRRGGADATGRYTEDGLVVLQGSTARLEELPSCSDTIHNLRKRLLDEGILVPKEDAFVFSKDYAFSSPSTASSVIVGGSSNGWTDWKAGDSQTLHDAVRSGPE